MRRDLWMILILGCLLILLLEAPAALSSVSAGLDGPLMEEGQAVQAAEGTSDARREEIELAGRDGRGT